MSHAFQDLLDYVRDKKFEHITGRLVKNAKREIYDKEKYWKQNIPSNSIKFEKFTEFLEEVRNAKSNQIWDIATLNEVRKEYKELQFWLSMQRKMGSKNHSPKLLTKNEQHISTARCNVIEEEQGPKDDLQTTDHLTGQTTMRDSMGPVYKGVTQAKANEATKMKTKSMDSNQTAIREHAPNGNAEQRETTDVPIIQVKEATNVNVRTADNGRTRTDDNGRTRTDDNGRTRTDDNGRTRTDDNGRLRTDDNGRTRTDDNPKPVCSHTKTIENKIGDMKYGNGTKQYTPKTCVVSPLEMKENQITSSGLELPSEKEIRSVYPTLFVNNDYMEVASEYCKLFNEDRQVVYDVLVQKQRQGKASIEADLFKLLEDIYGYAFRLARKQIDEMVEKTKVVVAGNDVVDYKVKDEDVEIIRQFRKIHGTVALPSLNKGYKILSGIDIQRSPEVDEFITKCMELLWCICTYDPPMLLDFNTEFKNSTDLQAAYMPYKPNQRGKRIDYALWPPLKLSTNGKILVKGLAHLR